MIKGWRTLFLLTILGLAGNIAVVGLSVAGNVENLPMDIMKALGKTGFDQKGLGIYVQAVDEDKPIISYQADLILNPASVIKLLTTAASLDVLGPGYQWNTQVYYTGDITEGKLKGDLYFRGNGDPYLTPERFWKLLSRVMIFGIQEIRGNVYVDDSYFMPESVDYAAFDEQPYRTYNVGPNAVLVGFQATEFHFDVQGEQLKIVPFPSSPHFNIVNKVKLVNGPCGRWQKRLRLTPAENKGTLQIDFSGQYARSCAKRTLYRRVSGRPDHFQHFFLPLWKQFDGTLQGRIATGVTPNTAKPAVTDESITLAEAVRYINKFSNNVMTRQLLLSLGAHRYGPPGTRKKGIDAVRDWLVSKGLEDEHLALDNGAGLSRKTRITAAQLGRMLHYVYRQSFMPEFMASLPVSGYDGTMAHRFINGPILGSAHIKTGLLDFVQSMAGYVTTGTGKRYVVVVLHNHPQAHTRAGEQLQNALIKWVYELDGYTRAKI